MDVYEVGLGKGVVKSRVAAARVASKAAKCGGVADKAIKEALPVIEITTQKVRPDFLIAQSCYCRLTRSECCGE